MFHVWLFFLTLVVSFGSSVLSGLSGGGGGMILTPYFIFIGLTPQQSVATQKIAGLGVAGGAMTAFRGQNLVHRRVLGFLIAITVVASIGAAWIIPHLNQELFQRIIAVLLIVLTPILCINPKRLPFHRHPKGWEALGYAVYLVVALLQGTFGTGLAILLVMDLMFLFGMSALEANATKRVAQLVQASLLFWLLLIQGLVVVGFAAATFIGSFTGCHVGSKLVLKGGEKVIKVSMAVVMVISGVALFFSVK